MVGRRVFESDKPIAQFQKLLNAGNMLFVNRSMFLSPHLRLNMKGPLPAHCNLLLHDAESIELTDQEACTMGT